MPVFGSGQPAGLADRQGPPSLSLLGPCLDTYPSSWPHPPGLRRPEGAGERQALLVWLGKWGLGDPLPLTSLSFPEAPRCEHHH